MSSKELKAWKKLQDEGKVPKETDGQIIKLNHLELNIRVMHHHKDKKHQAQMIGLFKSNAYADGKTQAEAMADLVAWGYSTGFLRSINKKDSHEYDYLCINSLDEGGQDD